MLKTNHALNLLNFITPYLFIILAFCKLDQVYTIISYEILAVLLGILVAGQGHITQGFWLLVAMYRYHRLEYYNHRKRHIALVIATQVSLMILFLFGVSGFYLTFCNAEIEEMHKGSGGEDKHAFGDTGICFFFV